MVCNHDTENSLQSVIVSNEHAYILLYFTEIIMVIQWIRRSTSSSTCDHDVSIRVAFQGCLDVWTSGIFSVLSLFDINLLSFVQRKNISKNFFNSAALDFLNEIYNLLFVFLVSFSLLPSNYYLITI